MCSNWTKPELEDTLEDVVNELEFVRLVLDSKERQIKLLRDKIITERGFTEERRNQLLRARTRSAALQEQLNTLQKKCNWHETRANELWESDCGIEYLTNTDGQAPCDCGFKFCPFCGKPIIENIMEQS